MKLLILFGYYFIVYILYIIFYMIISTHYFNYIKDVLTYLVCEHIDISASCSSIKVVQPVGVLLAVLTLLLNGISPLVHLIFVVDIQEMKEMCKKCKAAASDTAITSSMKTI